MDTPNISPRRDHRVRRGGHVVNVKRGRTGASRVVLNAPRPDPWAAVQAGLKRQGFAIANEEGAGHDG